MLRKLMKYEFKATGRIMLPLYAALLGLAVINKLFIGTNFNEINTKISMGVPAAITIIAYVLTMVAVFVGTLFIIVQRFYTNLFQDEGYLMNTIPVKSSQNIVNKLVVSVLWTIISVIVAIISVIIMAYEPDMFKTIIKEFKSAFIQSGLNFHGFIVFIILVVIGLFHGIMMLYTALAIGQLFKSKKLLGAFAGFMMISIVQQGILGIGAVILATKVNFDKIYPQHIFFSLIIIISILFIILFYITNYILKNKLNLE